MFNRKLRERVGELEKLVLDLSKEVKRVPFTVQLEYAKQRRLSQFADVKPLSTVYMHNSYYTCVSLKLSKEKYVPLKFIKLDAANEKAMVMNTEDNVVTEVPLSYILVTKPDDK